MESDGKIRFLRLSEFLRTESDEVHPISITQTSGMIKQRRGFDPPPPRKEEKRNRVFKMRNKNRQPALPELRFSESKRY